MGESSDQCHSIRKTLRICHSAFCQARPFGEHSNSCLKSCCTYKAESRPKECPHLHSGSRGCCLWDTALFNLIPPQGNENKAKPLGSPEITTILPVTHLRGCCSTGESQHEASGIWHTACRKIVDPGTAPISYWLRDCWLWDRAVVSLTPPQGAENKAKPLGSPGTKTT